MLMAALVAALRAQMSFDDYPVYNGADLGLRYQPAHSRFRVWAPTADSVVLNLYEAGAGGTAFRQLPMQKAEQGTWVLEYSGDLNGRFYTYRANIQSTWMQEVPDPYAFATGINGRRSAIIDRDKASPADWNKDQRPPALAAVDAVIYELHVRDASIHPGSGIAHKGKFLGLAESGTKNKDGLSTGLDHIRELGVTHVHLLPVFDFLSVDESKPGVPQYNWGYEPLNYNVPEGSYATNAEDPAVRIVEFKEMVHAFHQKELRLVMDVVYNHTMLTENSWFNQLVPGYYYRQNKQGGFSNATACGNEIASERPMVRKYILESLEFWMREYHVDGFRFDLMGVHDIETMRQIATRLRQMYPSVLLYGEGWTAGESPLPDSLRALKKNAAKLDGIAVFSDDLRDGIKGSVFVEKERGFVSGKPGMEPSIRFGVTAACPHPQVDYGLVNYSNAPYARDPGQVVSYVECHDNHVLWDKLALSVPEGDDVLRESMHRLALGIVLTSQGIPFLHAGTEFLRSKNNNENSYNAGDVINAINWDLKSAHQPMVNYVKALLRLRAAHPAFRLRTGKQVQELIHFVTSPPGMVAYTLAGAAVQDSWKRILVVYSNHRDWQEWKLPAGNWKNYPLPGQEQRQTRAGERVRLNGPGCFIYFEE